MDILRSMPPRYRISMQDSSTAVIITEVEPEDDSMDYLTLVMPVRLPDPS